MAPRFTLAQGTIKRVSRRVFPETQGMPPVIPGVVGVGFNLEKKRYGKSIHSSNCSTSWYFFLNLHLHFTKFGVGVGLDFKREPS
jgi:hypothetical protein